MSHRLRSALPILALLCVCAMPALSAEIPEKAGERPSWLVGVNADQVAQVREILAEHLDRLPALAGHPDLIKQMQALQNETLEKLAAVLTPDQLARLRASIPALTPLDRLIGSQRAGKLTPVTEAASPPACSDGYDSISTGRAFTEFACSDGACDYSGHRDHNPYSYNDYYYNCSARNIAADAEYLAYLALSDCNYADDAANYAAAAASAAWDGAGWAQVSEDYCWGLGHPNPCASNAIGDASNAYLLLNQGANQETACFACCITLSAPTGLHATATSATNIRLTWQDTNSKETNTKIERSTNAAAWEEIASVGANDTDHVDTAAASTGGHKYKVRTFNSTCNIYSPYSALALVPKAPIDLTGTKGTGAQFILRWQDKSLGINEQGFEIQRRVGTGSWEKSFKKVGADVETTTVTLVTGVNRFRVRAYTSTGETWFTNVVSYTY